MRARHLAHFAKELNAMLTEPDRKGYMTACPVLEDYLATMVQDLQYTEADEAREEGRDERDIGTIYTVRDETFLGAVAYCTLFYMANAEHIAAALELEPGEEGLRYGRDYITEERIGSTLWLACCGSGVTFTDKGDAPCLQAMALWARNNPCEAYMGDSGAVYLLRYSGRAAA